jgi:hypothetical protein
MFSDHFDILILKIIFKNKKYYFDAVFNEKQLLPHSQTSST